MVNDQDKRDLCEATGATYRDDVDAWVHPQRDGISWERPWSNVGDAIAALEAWRAKHGGWYAIESPCESGESDNNSWRVVIEDSEWEKCGYAEADTLPAAACRAILAAWRATKESK